MNNIMSSVRAEKRLSKKAGLLSNIAFEVLENRNLLSNTAPVATDDYYSTSEDTPLTFEDYANGVLFNDSDVNADPLTAEIDGTPVNGTVTFNPNGSFTYIPNANYNGSDTFSYRAFDGTAYSAAATVTIVVIAVNDLPTGTNHDKFTVDQNQVLTVGGTGLKDTLSDNDNNNDTIECQIVESAKNGTLNLNTSTGTFTYTPNTNFNGQDTFTFHFYDGTDYGPTYTATITVNHINQAPVAKDDVYSVSIQSGDDFRVSPAGVMTNDNDPDNDPLTAVKVLSTTHGILVFPGTGGFIYTPTLNYHGPDSATYYVTDGKLNSNTVTITFYVNNKAVGHDESYSAVEDTPLSINAANGVLKNCVEPDGEAMTARLITPPAHGTLTNGLNSDGSFLYTPNPDYYGQDTFVYAPADFMESGVAATVTLTISPVNDAPVAADDAFSVRPNSTLSPDAANGVLKNDSDVDNDPLSAFLLTNVSHGALQFNIDGSFTYAPVADYLGTDSFSYQVSDGKLTDTAVVTLYVTRPPVASSESYTLDEDVPLAVNAASGVLANDTDPENDALNATVVTPPAHGTLALNLNGSFTYTPSLNYNGTDSFTYRVNDSIEGNSIATVSFTINPVNDGPTAANDTYTDAVEDTPYVVNAANGVLANDVDVEGDPMTAFKVSNPAHGNVVLNTDGSFTYTPAANYNGEDSFTYKVFDGKIYSDIKTVAITLASVNDPPFARPDSNTVRAGKVLSVSVDSGVLANDDKTDTDYMIASLVTNVQHGTLSLNIDGSYVYTPAVNFIGTDSFTYYPTDGEANGNTVEVKINVIQSSYAPTAAASTVFYKPKTSSVIIRVDSLIADQDGDKLTREISVLPKKGTLYVDPNGTTSKTDDFFVYRPLAGYYGYDAFTYIVKDPGGRSAAATITLRITPASLVKSGSLYNLYVVGSKSNDSIVLSPSSGKVKVAINGTSQGLFNATGVVYVYGLEGNDVISAAKLPKSVYFYGGAGNDKITGSTKKSYLYGEDGNDTLYAGTSSDVLNGGKGTNILKKK